MNIIYQNQGVKKCEASQMDSIRNTHKPLEVLEKLMKTNQNTSKTHDDIPSNPEPQSRRPLTWLVEAESPPPPRLPVVVVELVATTGGEPIHEDARARVR